MRVYIFQHRRAKKKVLKKIKIKKRQWYFNAAAVNYKLVSYRRWRNISLKSNVHFFRIVIIICLPADAAWYFFRFTRTRYTTLRPALRCEAYYSYFCIIHTIMINRKMRWMEKKIVKVIILRWVSKYYQILQNSNNPRSLLLYILFVHDRYFLLNKYQNLSYK